MLTLFTVFHANLGFSSVPPARVFLSLAESDDTAAPFWRGHVTFTASYLGRGADGEEARRQAVAAARPVHVIR